MTQMSQIVNYHVRLFVSDRSGANDGKVLKGI